MEVLTSPAYIRRLMEKHGIRFSKKLGQNFIINPAICPRIAEEGGAGPEVCALEIGPGAGVLTAELAKRCKKVAAIELDAGLLPVLEETLAPHDNVRVIHGDVLKLDLHQLLREEFPGEELIVCANLPYYITTPILMKLLEERIPARAITVMVQKETALRLCAPLPSRQAGAITAAIHYYSHPQMLFTVSPGSFYPPPKVTSTVIRLERREVPAVEVEDTGLFFQLIKMAFGQRRKTILNALSAGFSKPNTKAEWQEILNEAGVPATARAEQLSLEDYAAIAATYRRMCLKQL